MARAVAVGGKREVIGRVAGGDAATESTVERGVENSRCSKKGESVSESGTVSVEVLDVVGTVRA